MPLDNMGSILRNAPLTVNFAGLTGNTMSMQSQGWELAIEKNDMASDRGGYQIRIAGRHRGMQLRIVSYPCQIDRSPYALHEMLRSIMFNIHICAESINFNLTDMSMAPKFQAVDFSRPEMTELTDVIMNAHVSLDQCALFKPFNDNETTVYVPKDEIWTMEKHLKAIKEMQVDRQKELRTKYRNNEYREERGSDPQSKYEEVKFQLVSV